MQDRIEAWQTLSHIEIELRYEVRKPSQLSAFLAPLTLLHKKHDIDVYLDNPDAELYQRGIFIRIRNGKKLDIKFNRACLDNPGLGMMDYCEEYSFALPLQPNDQPKINDLLVSLNLKPIASADLELLKSVNRFDTHYTVDKIRTSYKHEQFTVCVDEVADLGTFLEIELMAANIEHIERVKRSMQQLVSSLDLVPLKTGYGTLLIRKKDFKHYLLGRFILEEDKICRQQHSKGEQGRI